MHAAKLVFKGVFCWRGTTIAAAAYLYTPRKRKKLRRRNQLLNITAKSISFRKIEKSR